MHSNLSSLGWILGGGVVRGNPLPTKHTYQLTSQSCGSQEGQAEDKMLFSMNVFLSQLV